MKKYKNKIKKLKLKELSKINPDEIPIRYVIDNGMKDVSFEQSSIADDVVALNVYNTKYWLIIPSDYERTVISPNSKGFPQTVYRALYLEVMSVSRNGSMELKRHFVNPSLYNEFIDVIENHIGKPIYEFTHNIINRMEKED
jgi:hypothetical protein